MALDFVVDTIESVPEAFRSEYTEKDGKFHLAITGIESHFVPRAALTTANNENAQRRHALKAWETLAGGRTADDIGAIVSDFDSGKFSKGKTKEEFDAALAQHKTQFDRTVEGITGERDTAYSVARKAVVDGGLKGALASSKATKTGLAMLPKILGDRIDLKFENGEPVQRILNSDGKSPMIGTGTDGFATLDDLMKEAVKLYPDLFEGSGAGGGGAPAKGGGSASAKTITRAEWDKTDGLTRAAKVKEGYKVVD